MQSDQEQQLSSTFSIGQTSKPEAATSGPTEEKRKQELFTSKDQDVKSKRQRSEFAEKLRKKRK